MKILIAITSCIPYEDTGLNQPIRETWLPEAVARVAVERLGGPLVVDMSELVEGALEVDPGLEGDGPEERHRVDFR